MAGSHPNKPWAVKRHAGQNRPAVGRLSNAHRVQELILQISSPEATWCRVRYELARPSTDLAAAKASALISTVRSRPGAFRRCHPWLTFSTFLGGTTTLVLRIDPIQLVRLSSFAPLRIVEKHSRSSSSTGNQHERSSRFRPFSKSGFAYGPVRYSAHR